MPINEVDILSIPDDYEVYSEVRDPVTGKMRF